MSGLELLIPEHHRLFIGGSWREAASGATFSVRDPADGSVIAEVADGDVNDAVDALDTRPPRSSRSGGRRRRASAARSCAARSS